MFDAERLSVSASRKESHAAVREIVARAVAEPMHVLKALGEPKLAGIQTPYRADRLTILKVPWVPGVNLSPHDHRTF
jgi:predicted metal-dependent enzyme (double-stranded beta helix superfamily)